MKQFFIVNMVKAAVPFKHKSAAGRNSENRIDPPFICRIKRVNQGIHSWIFIFYFKSGAQVPFKLSDDHPLCIFKSLLYKLPTLTFASSAFILLKGHTAISLESQIKTLSACGNNYKYKYYKVSFYFNFPGRWEFHANYRTLFSLYAIKNMLRTTCNNASAGLSAEKD